MTNTTRTTHKVRSSNERIGIESFFGVFEVPETSSSYRVCVTRIPDGVSVAVLNWETSCEFGNLPTTPGSKYCVAEHLTDDNMVDAENLVTIFAIIDEAWRHSDANR